MQDESKREAPKGGTTLNFRFFYNPPDIRFSNPHSLYEHVFFLIDRGAYAQLIKEWALNKEKGKKQIETFLKKNGNDLLHRAIVINPDAKALECLYTIVEINILQRSLARDNYQLLERFLRLQARFEVLPSFIDTTHKQNQIDKFNILLKIDPVAVCGFMETNAAEDYMTSTIRESFETALKTSIDVSAAPPAN